MLNWSQLASSIFHLFSSVSFLPFAIIQCNERSQCNKQQSVRTLEKKETFNSNEMYKIEKQIEIKM